MNATASPRDHDIVVFGATGFVGKLTALHLAEHAPAGTRSLAGRSQAKPSARAPSWGPSPPTGP